MLADVTLPLQGPESINDESEVDECWDVLPVHKINGSESHWLQLISSQSKSCCQH